jgi:hypothetical protein
MVIPILKMEVMKMNNKFITINNREYNIIISNHVIDRILKDNRSIPANQIVPSIQSCIIQIEKYNNKPYDILLIDYTHKYSMVLSIKNNIITIITVIDKYKDVFIKKNTVIIEVNKI